MRNCSSAGLCIIAATAFLGGCLSPDREQLEAISQVNDEATVDAQGAAAPPSQPRTGAQRLNELVTQSRDDLASRLGLDIAAITVIEARHVIWPDSSGGCPMPGYDYMHVRTEGVLIRLQADGRIYQYHGGARGPAALCEKPSAIDPPSKFEER